MPSMCRPASRNLESGGRKRWTLLKSKAHNCMCVCRWLSAVTAKDLRRGVEDPYAYARASVLWSLATLWTTCSSVDNAPIKLWLDDDEIETLRVCKTTLADRWKWLAAFALRHGESRWKILPKNHAVDETLAFSITTGRNPASHWCFADENHMGLCKKIIARVHIETSSLRCLVRAHIKWAIHYRG